MKSSHDGIQTVLLFFEVFNFSMRLKVIMIARVLCQSYEYMKIIYENCRVKNYTNEDRCSYRHNFSSCQKKGCTHIAEVKGSLYGRALHWYRGGQEFESCTSLNFSLGFLSATAKVVSITALIFFHLRLPSWVWICFEPFSELIVTLILQVKWLSQPQNIFMLVNINSIVLL